MNRRKIAGLCVAGALSLFLCACGGTEDGVTAQFGAAEQEDAAVREAGELQAETQTEVETQVEAETVPSVFLDAARMEGVEENITSRPWEVTIPYQENGNIDTSRSYTIRENEQFYMERYLFGMQGVVVPIGFATLSPCPGAAEAMNIPGAKEEEIIVQISEEYENAAEFLELNKYLMEKIDEHLYYLVRKEEVEGYQYISFTIYKIIPKKSLPEGEAGEGGGIDDLSECQVVELHGLLDEESTASPEEIKELLLQASACISGDTGAPYLQDLLCSIDFGGYRIKNPDYLKDCNKEAYQEGVQTNLSVLLSDGVKDLKNVDALYVVIEADEEQGVENWISLQNEEDYADPQKALDELTERYLEHS